MTGFVLAVQEVALIPSSMRKHRYDTPCVKTNDAPFFRQRCELCSLPQAPVALLLRSFTRHTPVLPTKSRDQRRVIWAKSMVRLGSWGKVYSLQRHMALKDFYGLVAQVLCVEQSNQGILCPFSRAGAREVQLAASIVNTALAGMKREPDKREGCFVLPGRCPLTLQYSAPFQQAPQSA